MESLKKKKYNMKMDSTVSFKLSSITKNKQVRKSKTFKVMTNKQFRDKTFEEVFEVSLKEGSIPEEVKDRIKNAPRIKKRMYLLNFFDYNTKALIQVQNLLKKEILGNTLETAIQKKDIVSLLRDYVQVGPTEKKKFGEVTTPIKLVNEMLDTLPKDVWSNPDLKWLDPANGVGIFFAVVIERLMVGLKDLFEDEDERYKHIVENMLYMAELQPKNVFIHLCAFDIFDKYDLNVYQGSFLNSGFDNHMRDEWKIDKFDIIIGNPPYQDGSKTQGKNSSFWTKFIIKSFSLLKHKGYLNFITPISWIAPSETQKTELKEIFFQNNLMYLNTKCAYHFNSVGSTFSYYLIKKEQRKQTTIINGDFNKNLSDFPFLPKVITEESLSIVTKVLLNKKDYLLFSSGLRNTQYAEDGKYKVYYGNKFKLSNKLGQNYSIKKLIVNKPGYLKPRYDNGLHNTSDNNYWVEVKNETEATNISLFLDSKLGKFLFEKVLKYSGYNSLGVLKHIPTEVKKQKWNDSKLFKYFDLKEEEINLINKII